MSRRKPPAWQNGRDPHDAEHGSHAHDALMADFVQRTVIADLVERLHPPCVFFSRWSYKTHLEVPIRQHERIIGFADMVVTATRTLRCHLRTGIGRLSRQTAAQRNGNASIATGLESCADEDEPHECCQDGYWHLRPQRVGQPGRLQDVPDKLDIVLEFKTQVPSVGELLRQVNTYRTHRPADYYVVVTHGLCPQRELLQTEGVQLIERLSDRCWKTSVVLPDVGG